MDYPVMQRWLPAVIVLVIILDVVSSGSPTTSPSTRPLAESKPVEKDGLSVTLSTEQRVIPADEQPRFVVRFKNTSGDYINLYDIEGFWEWRIQFTNIDSGNRNPDPWRVRFDTIPGRGHFIDHRQVTGGQSTKVVIDLDDPPFTFHYVYEGNLDHLVAPMRFLSPGTYRVQVNVALPNPFGPGYHEWTGPIMTEPVYLTIGKTGAHGLGSPPTKEELSGYDDAIRKVTAKFPPGGLWMNGGFPEIKLPADAKPEDVIASAVNTHMLESKAYRILRVRKLDLSLGSISAALVKVGAKTKVLIFFPNGESDWWTRFYDTDFSASAMRAGTSSRSR